MLTIQWNLALPFWLLLTVPPVLAEDPRSEEFFEAKIRPVLVEQCYRCHSDKAEQSKKLRGGLKLDSSTALKAGGETGAAVVPGKPEEGTLLRSLRYKGDLQMPPSGKLDAAVIADFEKWIKSGAVDPRPAKEGQAVQSGIDLLRGRAFWSFQPLADHPIPAIEKPQVPVRNAIDAFVQAKWREQKLTPVELSDRRTLIRRVTFDLTGLPPTPAEVRAFEQDTSADAWQTVIDRLLASPQYGVRWARHWLDVARYSEDQAHTFAVKPKKNAYLYRDWVIQAFNSDMPYDRFVTLQIAGDLVPESEGDRFARLAGLGFMGLGAEYYKNTAREQAIAEELDDRVDTLTRGFLGLTVACARCHDHKFDPIPTHDYYAIAGIYNGTSLTSAPLVPDDEVKVYESAQAQLKQAEAKIEEFLNDKSRDAAQKAARQTAKYLAAVWETRISKVKRSEIARRENLNLYFLDRWSKFLDPSNKKVPDLFKSWFELKNNSKAEAVQSLAVSIEKTIMGVAIPSLPEPGKKAKGNKNNDPLAKALFLDANAPLFISTADVEKTFLTEADKPKLKSLRTELDSRRTAMPEPPLTAHVISGEGKAMNIYIRGNPATKGAPAAKGFLQVINNTVQEKSKDFSRLDLARVIASPDNPLTARVIVNRVWAWHFGRGLVSTPSNFGSLGDRPSHPELLDYLAKEFIARGWSIKWLHRQILNSSVYQLSSGHDPKENVNDAANVYLRRGRRERLDVESWRDALLFVSGNLDTTVGGPTFDLKDANAQRRTVYAKVSRHELDGLLRMFDFPDANVTADKRNTTTVPQQQLFALNSEFMIKQAQALSRRVEGMGATDAERIRAIYQLAFQREPQSRELEISERFLKFPRNEVDKLSRWEQYAQAILASNEFFYLD